MTANSLLSSYTSKINLKKNNKKIQKRYSVNELESS